MTQHLQQNPIQKLNSPKLDALCQDLDSFINELTISNPKKYDITPLELNKKEVARGESSSVLDMEIPVVNLHKSTSSISSNSSIASSIMSPLKELAPRTSSLNRTTSSSSGKSTNRFIPNSPRHFFSNPTSPLAFEIPTVHETLEEYEFPQFAFLSSMIQHLIQSVTDLNEHRKIYCSAEYPFSFNGEEIMDIIRSYLPPGISDALCLEFTQCYFNTSPPLIKGIDSTENRIRDSSSHMYTLIEEAFETDIQGVYTPFTSCYSTSCLPGQPGCYSPSCPNKLETLNGPISKYASKAASTLSYDTSISRAWSASVSKDILKTLPGDEVKRQEAIHELIYTEDDYVRDLRILDVDFAQELMTSQCIEEPRQSDFYNRVLNNFQDILDIHATLYQDLRDHQALCQAKNAIGAVDQIGFIFLRHMHRFEKAYLQYGPRVVLAEYEAKVESERNVVFQQFIKAREQLPQCRRLPFRHFIILPVTRLQRYALLLGAVLKKTPETHADHAALTQCMETIRTIAEKVDEATVITKNTLRIWQIDDRMRFKAQAYDLRLREEGRRLLKEGKLARRSHRNVDTIDVYVFVFDHAFVMTREKKTKHEVEYVLSKRPIPMELLQIQDATEGFSIGMRNMTETVVAASSSSAPFVVSHLGRQGADYMLYAENAAARGEWKEQLVQAKAMHELADIDKRVFEIRTLSDTTFSAGSSSQHNHGKVTCTVPFMGTSGIRMIAIGTNQGVWTGIEGDTNTIHLAIAISDVHQIAVLEDEYILLILADKTLYAYALDPLMSGNKKVDKPYQKIAQHISFFHAGVCQGRTIVVAMKKRGVDSNFRVLEPVCGDLRDPKNSKFFTKSGLFGKTPSWFKSAMEFYIGTESYTVHFLKARIVVVCARGFEIINLDALSLNRNLPDMTHPDFAFVQQRVELARPLGMFKCRENYLLCYNAFVFMVDVHGGLVKEAAVIEWEGVPQSVAFYYPYVIGFDARFVEIRHVETGELIQVLAGTHMRCLQFINNPIAPDIHGCMAHPFKPDYQYIFQLVGTFEPPLL